MKEWVQIFSGALLTLVLIIFGVRLLPFVLLDPVELPRGEGRILKKTAESLSGSTRPSALTYLVTVEVADPPGRIESILSREDFDALAVGDSIHVVRHRGRARAVDDLRWHGPHRSRFWLILGATVVIGAETLRRFVRRLGSVPPSSP